MIARKVIAVCVALSATIGVCFAQVDFPHKKTMSDMRIDFPEYNLPKGYKAGKKDILPLYPKIEVDDRLMTPFGVIGAIWSKDSSFLMLLDMIPLNSILDSNQNKEWFSDIEERQQEGGYGMGFWRTWKPNEYHQNRLMYLLSIQQKTFTFDKDTLVHYYTHVQARTMFNADTVIRVDINLPRFYDGKPTFTHENRDYNHMQAYVIHRHDRGFFILFCFTNDIGQRDFDKHFKAMQQIFRYKDDE